MFSHSQPDQAPASVQSMLPAEGGCNVADDVALGCESADPALQIAMWGQEAEPAAVAA